MPVVPAPATSVAEVLDLYATWGHEGYDEVVSQLDHALQTAALAGADRGAAHLVAAALLHDVGHLLELRDGGADGLVDRDLGHEHRGTRWLGALFPPAVTAPIALHVAAKRYRCAVDPRYHDTLSDGSRRSLVRQGGPMTDAETERFAAHPAHGDAVELRGWDDHGKVIGIDVGDLGAYVDLLQGLAQPSDSRAT